MVIRTQPITQNQPTRLASGTIDLASTGSMVQLPTQTEDTIQLVAWMREVQAKLKQLGVWSE